MRINQVGANTTPKFSFKSIRSDRQTVLQLSKGEKPIIENNKQNIYAALNNLSQHTDETNISFLLDIADNLAYGQRHNSVFKDRLDEEHITPENRENTDWFQLLDDTISQMISKSDDDTSVLIEEYKRIFTEKQELTPEQKDVLDLRKQLTSQILAQTSFENAESLEQTTNIRQNLDYFIASSETPIKQKKECLEKLVYFLSDDYKITPQLQDKKLQVLDEVLNDIVVKTPADDVLKTKAINQRQSGMCAAISICRKAMAYEDKAKFIDLITEELKDSPTMSVYDVTALGSGKKVEIPKIKINYNVAIAKGYRIVDASAHNWMHNAHAAGDGTIQTENYIAFDDENYGIFDDSGWYTSENDTLHSKEKSLLRALIKEKEFIDSFYKTKQAMTKTHQSVFQTKKEVIASQTMAIGKLNNIFDDIFRNCTIADNTRLIKSLFKFYQETTDENEANVPKKIPDETKQEIIINYLKASLPNISPQEEEGLEENKKAIFEMTEEYVSADKKLAATKRFSTPRNKYLIKRKLFNIAAAHRVAIERDVNLQDGIMRFEKLCNLPPRDIQITDYLKSIKTNLNSYEERKKYTREDGSVPTKQELEAELNKDILKIETTIPKKLNDITSTLYDKDLLTTVKALYENSIEAVKSNEEEITKNIRMTMDLPNDKQKIIAHLEKWLKKLSDNPSEQDILNAVRLLGYDNRMHITEAFIHSFFTSLQQGIAEEQYNRLIQIFGGSDKLASGLEYQNKKFQKVKNEYNNILDKWKVPTARELIMNRLEKQHDVLSRKKLDKLQNHFAAIQAGIVNNERIKNSKARDKANNQLYSFSNEENEIFDEVEKNLSQIRKFCNMEYNNLNDLLFDELEAHYAQIGKLNGQFWVREEGSSGLYANEQIRIIEQMTGKPYHIQSDITEAAKEIKEGKGSGILAMSIDDSDYAFHAQYAPAVTQETITNPVTGEKEIQDVIWTDNSWGDAEKEYFWDGRNGFYHTDYGRGYGLKDGFLLSNDGKIGLPIRSIHGATGVATEDDGEKFGLFSDVILPGSPVDAYQKLYKMFNYILNMQEGETQFKSMESQITSGKKFSIDEVEGMDKVAEGQLDRITKRIEKEIKTEEDFDKLPENDDVKMAFKRLAVYLSTNNPLLADMALWTENDEDLKEVSDNIFGEQINSLATIVAKTADIFDMIQSYSIKELKELLKDMETKFNKKYDNEDITNTIFNIEEKEEEAYNGSLIQAEDIIVNKIVKTAVDKMDTEDEAKYFIEQSTDIVKKAIEDNIKIKSFDNPILVSSPLYKQLIKSVDKYLEPKTDAEMLQLIQEMQIASKEQAKDFFDALEPEDVGIINKKPYDYLLRYKAGSSSLYKSLYEVVCNNAIFQASKTADENGISSEPEDLYRSLYVKLSEMDVQKYIKAFKDEAFQKYKVRQAFPEPVVISDSSIYKTVTGMIDNLKEDVDGIYSSQNTLNVLIGFEKLRDNFIFDSDFMALYNNPQSDEIVITPDNMPIINDFLEAAGNLYQETSKDASFKPITKTLKEISASFIDNDVVDAVELRQKLNHIVEVFDNLKDSGITKAHFKKLKTEELATLNSKVKVIVEANIEPKYRDDAYKRINNIINMYKNDVPSEVLDEEIECLAGFIIRRHIVKNPTVLLKEVTKMLFDGKQDTDEYKILRNYLVSALNVAQQTKIQYKLVQNQHEGISTKTRDILPLFCVTMPNGEEKPMDSEEGMIFIMKQLQNTGDGYATLNLLLNQSGMSEKALNAMLNYFQIDKTYELIDDKVKEILEDVSNLDKITNDVDNYMQADKVQHKDIRDSIDSLTKYLKQNTKNYKEIPVYKQFIEYLEAIEINGTFENNSQEVINSLTKSIIYDALENIAGLVNETLESIQITSEFLNENIQLISTIKVPENSQAYAKREDFFKVYQDIQTYIAEKLSIINNAIKTCKFFEAQKV